MSKKSSYKRRSDKYRHFSTFTKSKFVVSWLIYLVLLIVHSYVSSIRVSQSPQESYTFCLLRPCTQYLCMYRVLLLKHFVIFFRCVVLQLIPIPTKKGESNKNKRVNRNQLYINKNYSLILSLYTIYSICQLLKTG